MHTKSHFLRSFVVVLLLAAALPCQAVAAEPKTATQMRMEAGLPFEQDFVITAYYSPKPRQCSYVMGDEHADKVLNGQGTNGADGTAVYPGMAAAPRAYPFGTRLVLPGIGTVTVHDRGGAIIEGVATHRLDIWAGAGEEGLARALAFGVQRVRGVVYPAGSLQPEESIDLQDLPAPVTALRHFLAENAKLQDCDAMITFGKSLVKKVRVFAVSQTRFAFVNAPPPTEMLTFFPSGLSI